MLETLTNTATRHRAEGVTTTKIEQATSKIPSGAFLIAGLASIALAAGLAASGKMRQANFVGQWVPTFLLLGVYNKLVKQHEPD